MGGIKLLCFLYPLNQTWFKFVAVVDGISHMQIFHSYLFWWSSDKNLQEERSRLQTKKKYFQEYVLSFKLVQSLANLVAQIEIIISLFIGFPLQGLSPSVSFFAAMIFFKKCSPSKCQI